MRVVLFSSEENDCESDLNSQEFLPINSEGDKDYGYLPPGKYWVGDLTYVMDEFFDEYLGYFEGVFRTKKGNNFAIIKTAGGDGTFVDYDLNSYPVDAGLIGCVESKGVKETDSDDYGCYHFFEYPFKCSWHENGGYIQLGIFGLKLLALMASLYHHIYLP